MNVKKIWANYAVANLQRTTEFYTKLGFRANGKPNDDLTSFLFGDEEFVVHFFVKESLEAGIKGKLVDVSQGNEIVFTLAAHSKDDVDRWAAEVEEAGGVVVSRPAGFGEGYYGFIFTDPDGHKFNVFFMEGL